MTLVAVVVLCGLIVGQDGGRVGAALPGSESAPRTRATGGRAPHLNNCVAPVGLFFLDNKKNKKVLCAVSSGSVLSALTRRSAGDLLLADDPNLCFSLRENDDQRQLLCNDRRSKFNFNPFGLRFGKRFNSYIYRRAVKRARTKKFSPLTLYPRELEVPT